MVWINGASRVQSCEYETRVHNTTPATLHPQHIHTASTVDTKSTSHLRYINSASTRHRRYIPISSTKWHSFRYFPSLIQPAYVTPPTSTCDHGIGKCDHSLDPLMQSKHSAILSSSLKHELAGSSRSHMTQPRWRAEARRQ